MEKKLLVSPRDTSVAGKYQSLLQDRHEIDATLIPSPRPIFINPKATISQDGRILNLSEFKSLDDIFDFSLCLECPALQHEHYGSSCENPCMKCHCLTQKIKEKNTLSHHVLHSFKTTSLLH